MKKTREELEEKIKELQIIAYILLALLLFAGILTLYYQEIKYPQLENQLLECQQKCGVLE